ncbi:glycosyl transferase family protein [Zwartia sp.]|uniref:glycosyl transferase family protein n=1 Tax=Zwartia sp. TaxID=2978004 RepID=UPI0027283D4A|nr:glycosyl transferase family protein [Zwartia sp.]MDO9023997.1 glycosyl transferase family protein [Zwartia sp.]
MELVDYLSLYLFGLKFVVIFIAIFITISGADDLLIDLIYWIRWFWRKFTIYKHHSRADQSLLLSVPEKPLAIMIPAWQETGVIGSMADKAARTLDYENYHIFVGTYPNDPDTQRDVDEVCALFPNVHKVVCARPGPTSKADCLNNVLDAIMQFERRANLQFAGFILHDSEDVVSPMELRLFNYLVGRKDLIQVPVYPFERKWYDFVGMHYIDEFTELHAKDVPVREAVVGQVPSAGVGTCFSRRAIETLLIDGDGIAFDTQSLTEDYDIGFRLKARGLEEIFVRFSVQDESKSFWKKTRIFGQSFRESSIICVREFFPNKIATAVRQKSRWIIGIVFQGYVTHGWTRDWRLNYFLWRDRKGVFTNFFSFAANIILFQLIIIWLYQAFWPDAYRFLSIFEESELLILLLWINAFFMVNRIFQRTLFVTQYYGLFQGLLSLPRMLLGNLINFLANWRAIKQVIQQGNPRRVAWDKTTHDFPAIGEISRARRMLGSILVKLGFVSEEDLKTALLEKSEGMRLGTWLVHSGQITPLQLAQGIAEQANVSFQSVDAYLLSTELIARVPPEVALHYAVLPVNLEANRLTVASESSLSPIALSALRRKLGMDITYIIAEIGQVTVGLRHCYARYRLSDPLEQLNAAVAFGRLQASDRHAAWQYYVSRQIMLGEVLQTLGRIDSAAFSAVLLQHASSELPLGEYLVENEIITQGTLDHAISLQAEIQPSMEAVIAMFDPANRPAETLRFTNET